MKRVLAQDFHLNVSNLARLPIPKIDDTLARYRLSIHPFKKSAQRKHLDKLDAFLATGAAAKLQTMLVQQDEAARAAGGYPHSYIEKLWDDAYLNFRGPSPINIAPAFAFRPFSKPRTQAEAAAAVVNSILKWIHNVQTVGLEVPLENPTDVSQLQTQFCFSRLSQPDRDGLVQYPLSTAQTITVLRGGHPYIVTVVDGETKLPVSEDKIREAISQILTMSPVEHAVPMSILTAGGRSDWASSYAELKRIPENADSFEKIQRSIIVVCLDSIAWGTDVALKQQAMLIGGAEELENRWYEKHQIIVSADGQVAANFEHAFSDGLTWSRWLKEVHADIESGGVAGDGCLPSLQRSPAPAVIEPVTITFGKVFATTIRSAKQQMKKHIAGITLDMARIPFGKKQLKQLKFSPDAFAQICFHMGYHQLRNKIAPTYESCSTARFFHGRTETIRTASPAMAQFVLEAASSSSPPTSGSAITTEPTNLSELKVMATAAAHTHASLAKSAADGQGIDRHLLALKDLARSTNDTAALEFFSDDLYVYSGTWLMSTSNVSQPHMNLFNFGPVTGDGYGLGYIVDEEEIRVTVSSFAGSSKTNSAELSQAITAAAQRLKAILTFQ